MAHQLVPASLPTPLVAALTGHSVKYIRRLLALGVLPYEGERRRRVPTAAVEELTGRQITAEDYLRAERRLDEPREAMRDYHRNRNMSPVAGITTQPPKPHSLPGGSDNGVAFQRQDHGADAS